MDVSPLEQEIKNYLQPRLPDYLNILQEMVEINSFTSNPAGVNELSKLTEGVFAALGFSAETIPSANPDFGDHLILTRQGKSGRKIGFVSHLDTVFSPEEEIQNNFVWREECARIYGPGTVDIKGGTLIMFMVLDALRSVAPEAFNDITWVALLNSSEERFSPDFGELCLKRLSGNALACLVFEGGQLNNNTFRLAVSRKGMAIYKVTATGKAAHAGNSHRQGANAIVQLSDTIRQIAALTDYEKRLTFNIGAVSGGSVTNRVPHYAEAKVEMRAFSQEVYDEGVAQMLALNGQSSVSSADGQFSCQVAVEITSQSSPWPENPGTERLFQTWAEAAEMMGAKAEREHRGGLSDGNEIWHAIPTLDALGPAGANAHCSERSPDGSKDQEYAITPSFVPKAVLNTLAILKLIGD